MWEIMALKVDPIPQECNMSNRGIAHKYKLYLDKGTVSSRSEKTFDKAWKLVS